MVWSAAALWIVDSDLRHRTALFGTERHRFSNLLAGLFTIPLPFLYHLITNSDLGPAETVVTTARELDLLLTDFTAEREQN